MNHAVGKKSSLIADIKRVYSELLVDMLAENITLKTYSEHLAPQIEGIFLPPNYLMYPLIKVKRKLGGKSLVAKGKATHFFLSVEDFLNDENILNIRRELAVVAHEFGHYLSYKKGKTRKPGYDESLDKMNHSEIHLMTPYQKNLVLDEEKSAWHEAQEVLLSKNYTDWSVFNALKEESLGSYRQFMQIKDENPWFIETKPKKIKADLQQKNTKDADLNQHHIANRHIFYP